MDDRAQRIVDTAVALAERDGYSAVRLRDVAATAQVALGTVYKRFSSKEEILIAALQQESEKLVARVAKRPPEGDTPRERLCSLLAMVTRGLLRRPNLTRALIRSIASSDPKLTERIASFHEVVMQQSLAAMRGESPDWQGEVDEREADIVLIVQHVWFAALVGWAGGLHDAPEVSRRVELATQLIFEA